jgi:arabinofuranosyltransferase
MSPLAALLERPAVRAWRAGDGLPRWVHVLVGLVLPLWVLSVNMWRVHWFTIDDSYISFRYARNLARGLGLVYNPGEAVEGYTNFLWTVVLAGGMRLGLDPHVVAKLLGAAAALGCLVLVYRLAERLMPLRTLPCVATWLLASSAPFSSHAVQGLETSAFTFLVLLGTWRMFLEVERGQGVPWSGLAFALAGLTRPEAPMFVGLPMLLLGRGFVSRQNLVRAGLFAAPLLAHLVWRHAYYGQWLPATLAAKTGDLHQQWKMGTTYVAGWLEHAGPVVFFACLGLGIGVARRHREILSVCAVAVACVGYVLLVGGDWMSYYRFLAPAGPFVFLLVGLGLRRVVETRDTAALVAVAAFGIYAGWVRLDHLREAQDRLVKDERRYWANTAGQAAEWLATRAKPGRVAIGDIGFVGWRTDYPILDLLGLVDPVINKLPGGYTRKIGERFVERYFEVRPEYAVLVMKGDQCNAPAIEGVAKVYYDPRFGPAYALAHQLHVQADVSWCIFQRRDVP